MKLSWKAAAAAAGLLWGGAIFLVAAIATFVPGYGGPFLELVSSVYPGYDNTGSWLEVLVGTVYGIVDGAVCGALFAGLYNLFAGRQAPAGG